MNKLILIKAMREVIRLYLSNNLTIEEFENILNIINNTHFNEEQTSYEEALFISYLFENIPYYQILPFLNDLFPKLPSLLKSNPKLELIAQLMEGYLSELLPSIMARISTEVSAHVYELLKIFYQKESFNQENTIKRLKRNIYQPSYLASADIAEGYIYQQQHIEGINIEEEALRETISRNNYNKKNNIERATQKLMNKFYDEESYKKFLSELKRILNSADENKETIEFLKDEIFIKLEEFHIKAKNKWDEQQIQDPYQLTLKF